jgi:hypothetical protein
MMEEASPGREVINAIARTAKPSDRNRGARESAVSNESSQYSV